MRAFFERVVIGIELGALVAILLIAALSACAPMRALLPVVRSVLELADELCVEGDSLELCASKCEAEAARRAQDPPEPEPER